MNYDILSKLQDEVIIDNDIELDSRAKSSIFHTVIKEMCLTFLEYLKNNKVTNKILVLDDDTNIICGIYKLEHNSEYNKYNEYVLELDKNNILKSNKERIYYSQQKDLQKLFKSNMYKRQNILVINEFNDFVLKIFDVLCKNSNMLGYIEILSSVVRLVQLSHNHNLYLIEYKNDNI